MSMENLSTQIRAWISPILMSIVAFFLIATFNEIREISKEVEELRIETVKYGSGMENINWRINQIEKKLERWEHFNTGQ